MQICKSLSLPLYRSMTDCGLPSLPNCANHLIIPLRWLRSCVITLFKCVVVSLVLRLGFIVIYVSSYFSLLVLLVAWSLAVRLACALVYGLHISCLYISCLHLFCSAGWRSDVLLRSAFINSFSSHSCCLVIGCSSGWRSGLWLAY